MTEPTHKRKSVFHRSQSAPSNLKNLLFWKKLKKINIFKFRVKECNVIWKIESPHNQIEKYFKLKKRETQILSLEQRCFSLMMLIQGLKRVLSSLEGKRRIIHQQKIVREIKWLINHCLGLKIPPTN